MSGRGLGGKGLGAYRANIDPKQAKELFLRVLPKVHHKAFLGIKHLSDRTIQSWLHTVVQGEDWEKRNLREQLSQQLPSRVTRFNRVEEITPLYNIKKQDHRVKTLTKARKKKALAELVQLPFVKYKVGAPQYIRAQQEFKQYAKKLT